MLIGAAIVVALVGYGVITPETLSHWGDTLRQWINDGASFVKDATEGNVVEQIKDKINN
jgi:predicted flap endonuclease-1-like 5' DNA nuclease